MSVCLLAAELVHRNTMTQMACADCAALAPAQPDSLAGCPCPRPSLSCGSAPSAIDRRRATAQAVHTLLDPADAQKLISNGSVARAKTVAHKGIRLQHFAIFPKNHAHCPYKL